MKLRTTIISLSKIFKFNLYFSGTNMAVGLCNLFNIFNAPKFVMLNTTTQYVNYFSIFSKIKQCDMLPIHIIMKIIIVLSQTVFIKFEYHQKMFFIGQNYLKTTILSDSFLIILLIVPIFRDTKSIIINLLAC